MNQNLPAQRTSHAAKLRTAEAAKFLKIQPATMRRAYCVDGQYCGLVPLKMPNRLLLWDAAEVERLLAGEGSK